MHVKSRTFGGGKWPFASLFMGATCILFSLYHIKELLYVRKKWSRKHCWI